MADHIEQQHTANGKQKEEKMITVVITTWQVPFGQTVQSITQFGGDDANAQIRAIDFINEASKKWWDENEGDRCRAETQCDLYEEIGSLTHNDPRYELWGGEVGFHAMIDNASYWRLHEAHYVREYDAKGLERPGYLQVAEAYNSGDPEKITEVERKQQEVFDYYNKRKC